MSMITKQIEQLQLYADIADLSKDDSLKICAKAMREAAETISELSEKLHAANMERSSQYYNQGWIPCSERLPDELMTKVFVTIQDNNGLVQTPQIALYNGYTKTFEGFEGSNIIAWMPLPELPRLED